MKYQIEVNRIVREYMTVEVIANTLQEAKLLAKNEAIMDASGDSWNVYDCEYWIDD